MTTEYAQWNGLKTGKQSTLFIELSTKTFFLDFHRVHQRLVETTDRTRAKMVFQIVANSRKALTPPPFNFHVALVSSPAALRIASGW